MFILKSILTPFLLPPGIFITILIFTGAWLLNKKKWKPGIATLTLVGFAWALSIGPVSDAMIGSLESEYSIPKNIHGDVIILLGSGVFSGAPDLSGVGIPSDVYLTRIVTAVRLQKKLAIPIIVSGREVPEDEVSENPIVKRFLLDLGVPAGKIIIENKSRDTYENAQYSRKICVMLGFKNPILVTSAYHMERAVISFKMVGLKVLPFPAGFKSWRGKQYRWDAYLPGDFTTASIAIKEYLGIVFYKLAYSDKF